ncbi:diflavin flavoprotein [Nodosilinea sp. LEGE 07088]|uniref:diflavin flavoprotein n=1 Tax=Nodosilinea sp. LEGE 07088 TaxID=2777968 RepID=UPI001881F12F|nr:diflavin flavoprotein [Nodosilinea sp. LEGE 07088]MBE9137354.1 diflavin flavoprotein [Nodosilinea sp. LEGE 07088]
MTLTTPSASLPTMVRPRDVQVATIGLQSQVLRSRAWERLKFEVEYSRQRGTTANAYLIQADQTALLDPPGESFTALFLTALEHQIDLTQIDYIVTSHVNANRLATLTQLMDLAPQAQIVCSRAAANTLKIALADRADRLCPVRSGETLDLGQGHVLEFMSVPTPRWPDGLCTYDPASQVLFSDKLFGTHLCDDALWDEQWRSLEDDRRYYFDCLHSPQAKQVETALDLVEPLPLKTIAPGHGPLVRYSLSRLRQDYRQWCQQQAQQPLRVALLYASAYGNTAQMADAIAQALNAAQIAVEAINCEQADPNGLIDTLNQCDGFIIGSPTLGGHAPVQIQTALGLILANVPKTKLVGVFGSYGWSGEAIDELERKLKDANYSFGFEPLRVRFSPDQTALASCTTAAAQFAQGLRKRQKQQGARPAIAEAHSDRTAQALGRVIGSLCVVTTQNHGMHSGLLTAWVAQASFSPPGLMLALPTDAAETSQLRPGTGFVLNILKEGRAVRRHFSARHCSTAAFEHLSFSLATNGCAILTDGLAYVECTVEDQSPVGDHLLVYATVRQGELLAASGMPAINHRKSGHQY